MRTRLAGLALFALLLVAGCSSEPTRDINDPTNSLVFGYIDMSNAPTPVSHAWIEQLAPPTTGSPYWTMEVKDGMFYAGDLPAGKYQMNSVWGSAFLKGDYSYGFGRQSKQTQVRITKPGIYYLGSFKYRPVKTGMFEGAKFAIDRIKDPSEAELLKKLLENDSTLKNSAWAEKIRARLAHLKR